MAADNICAYLSTHIQIGMLLLASGILASTCLLPPQTQLWYPQHNVPLYPYQATYCYPSRCITLEMCDLLNTVFPCSLVSLSTLLPLTLLPYDYVASIFIMSTFTVKARCASSGSENSPTSSPTEPSSTTFLSGDAPILETPAHPLERHIFPISDPEDRNSDPIDPVFGDEAGAAIHYKTMSWWYVLSVLPSFSQ
jgi:hypothetical protein